MTHGVTFFSLPTEIINEILGKLDENSLSVTATVCKTLTPFSQKFLKEKWLKKNRPWIDVCKKQFYFTVDVNQCYGIDFFKVHHSLTLIDAYWIMACKQCYGNNVTWPKKITQRKKLSISELFLLLPFLANFEENDELIKLLFNYNAPVDMHDVKKYTPLHNAALQGRTKICKLLLDHGADINNQTPDGFTPLHAAVRSKTLPTVNLLLQHGADTSLTIHDTYITPYIYAVKLDHWIIACKINQYNEQQKQHKSSIAPKCLIRTFSV